MSKTRVAAIAAMFAAATCHFAALVRSSLAASTRPAEALKSRGW